MKTLLLVTALTLAQPDADYRWVHTPTDPTRLYLYRADVQVGAYDLDEHFYRPYDAGRWGPRGEPPLPPPCFGVETHRISGGPTYRLNGRRISAAAAYQAVEKGLDDDGQKLRVSVIGPKSVRDSATAAIASHQDFAELKERVVLRNFDPDHWAMRPGFVTTGQPTIYCQAPTARCCTARTISAAAGTPPCRHCGERSPTTIRAAIPIYAPAWRRCRRGC